MPYNPIPYARCVIRLNKRATHGRGVREAAIPKPNAGCKIKNGAIKVNKPVNTPVEREGSWSQPLPLSKSGITAKIIPVR